MPSTTSSITQAAVRLTVLVLVLTATGCAPPDSRTQRTAARDSTPSEPADTSVIQVQAPTLLAHFPITQAEVDASEDGGEALGDFQYHLGGARDSLSHLGLALEIRYTPAVQYRLAGRVTRFVPPADSGVAYLFLAPDRPTRTYFGVLTDADLVDLAHRFVTGTPEP